MWRFSITFMILASSFLGIIHSGRCQESLEEWELEFRNGSTGHQPPAWGLDHLSPEVTGHHSPRRSLWAAESEFDSVAFLQSEPDGFPAGTNFVRNAAFPGGGVGALSGWSPVEFSHLRVETTPRFHYLVSSHRLSTRAGVAYDIAHLSPGMYRLMVWVKLSHGRDQAVEIHMVHPGNRTRVISTGQAKSTAWTKLLGGFTLNAAHRQLSMRVVGPAEHVDILLARPALQIIDVNVVRVKQRNAIQRLRTRPVSLTLVDSGGTLLQGTVTVKIDEMKADFPFGAALSGAVLVDPKFQDWFRRHFNWAVFENEAKWYYNQGSEGGLTYVDADAMVKYCRKWGIKIRGHNVFWNVGQYVQNWVSNLDRSGLASAVRTRLYSVVSHFKGAFLHWDVNNEMLHGTFFSSRLGRHVLPWMYRATKKADPHALTFVNDYNVVEYSGDPLASPEAYLNELYYLNSKAAGVGAIGIEGHFFGVDQPRLKADLDQFRVTKLPVWITELDIDDQDPVSQAKKFEQVMRTAFAHPVVHGIMLWEVARPPCSEWKYIDPSKCTTVCYKCLVDQNWNTRPIGRTYFKLRKEWSTHIPAKVATNSALPPFNAFHGKYRATVTTSDGIVHRLGFHVPKERGGRRTTLQVTLVV